MDFFIQTFFRFSLSRMGVMDCTFPPYLSHRNMCCHGPLHDRITSAQDVLASIHQLVGSDGFIPAMVGKHPSRSLQNWLV